MLPRICVLVLIAVLASCRPEIDEAAPAPRTAAPQSPRDKAELRRKAALALWMQGKREEALAEVAAALDLAPDFAELHMMRGQLFEELQKPAEARVAIERALELDPKHVSARLTLARLLVRAENLD